MYCVSFKKFHVPWELCKQCKMFLLYKRRKKSAFPCSIGKHLDNLHVCWNKGTTTEQSSHEGSLQPRRNTAHISNTLVYVASVQSGESSTLILTLTATSVRKGVPAPRRQNRKAPTRFPPRRRTALLCGQRLPASVQPPVPQATRGTNEGCSACRSNSLSSTSSRFSTSPQLNKKKILC